ncbi:histone deacetylase [Coccidioides posadasii str. Silveira]|uniref:Histone deacetylase n=3 Tax=Coccidioides posadasii TaxID=199306 RepID=E9D914_COCPS|nr:histone deacetylase HosA, putative [Coccidioides posadasii C735 delta SOWgp]EER29608.1 histone deacetylase HosA, putative [Coccidioides posadasii C735 delta SOWgp]EFW17048.1 histone deacetylase phd1 [Coccidioides posadasii str. Silveira]KMM69962.1 histone deacetylase 1 [Coccidioides posadasii RMSCC 3488]QVM09158.1 histone deacetylase [Coccidioides posadasii str. Silveira]|eukprot:XP_003071753.1 histone deacetylase HosA, putative [Coccidioides posadasii C735 delta SOWgp]
MARSTIVQEYGAPPIPNQTLALDAKTANEVEHDIVKRPKGYRVSWHANPAVEPHHFGSNHPMKPWRLTLTKQLVLAYGMHHAMDLYLSRSATYEEMAEFHSTDYLEFLTQVMPADMESTAQVETLARFNFGDDCPVFDGLYNYCSLYAGATLDAARKLCNNQSEIAINWSGGLHHAKKSEASGFCYVNDIVLGILQLLRIHPRVMYIDIDVHHGDGVEQAFWSTDRVLTVSFHKYDKENFFPGTGPLDSTGPSHPLNPGAHHSLNVPLNDGIEDNDYIALFKAIIGPCIRTYQPGAIVLQCGADSLGCDRLGCFNLNIRAHGACVAYTKTFGLPTLVVGGGGYTPRNVSRLWAYETAICLEAESDLNPVLPDSLKFRNHFRPDCTLFPPLSEMRKVENKNSKAYLDSLVQSTMEQLRYIKGAPSVQMSVIPPDILGLREEIEKELEEEKLLGEEEKEDRDGAGVNTLGIGGSRPSRRKDQEKGLGVRGELYT